MTTSPITLRFPDSAGEDAHEDEYLAARADLAASWDAGSMLGHRFIAIDLTGVPMAPELLQVIKDFRQAALLVGDFDRWWGYTAGSRSAQRIPHIAQASGFCWAWSDHPHAEQCGNCDLPLVPRVEDGWVNCPNHSYLCSDFCYGEACTRECRDAIESDRDE